MRTNDFDFLLRTGRAVLYPVYSGTFERHRENSGGPYAQREWTILLAKDVVRSVDFLQSRPDLQSAAVAYYGLSIGGAFGPIFLALEPRFKTSVLVGGALLANKAPPEVDVVNFAPRVAVPVLMLNGRLDFQNPYETLQKPLFRWLGVAEPNKRHVLFETGHLPPVQDLMRETLSWLDRYLGPVTVQH
jgi:dienelactone hydrolase